jgi:23S rRNA (adenine2503-C2)-methyltransferase
VISEPVNLSRAAGPRQSSAAPARPCVLGMTREEIHAWLAPHGHKPYRADQLVEWVFDKGAASWDEMSSLPKSLRQWLADNAELRRASVAADTVADDGTRKLLLRFPDGASVETVWIPSPRRHTVCVSSQVGCPVGCRFCASGLDGVVRNLSAAEIVEQALLIRGLIREGSAGAAPQAAEGAEGERGPDRLTNIVLMGMGEPLANYRDVLKAVRIMNAPWGLGVGARKITISTVGLARQIRDLAREELQVNLSLSLHAPDDELRRELIPWRQDVPIAELLDACHEYFRVTGREITLEYVLLEGVNDRPEHARKLAVIARRIRANVNLLRYNPVPGLPFRRPSAEAAFAFQALLREQRVNVHVRTSRGSDVQAACGQLRRQTLPTQ